MDKKPQNKKLYKEEEYNNLEIKNQEKLYLHNAFNYLCELENEPSSDDNSKEKIYQRKIEANVQKKKMNLQFNYPKKKTNNNSTMKSNKKTKNFKEDEPKDWDDNPGEEVNPDLYKDPQNEEEKLKHKKFGVKAIRKVFHKLTKNLNKNEIKLMIWEVDTNLDGFISFEEYERMYKRCVLDNDEREPKKLYYLVQFLMFDKEKKNYITIEDTLEILCVRNTDGIDSAINDIFGIIEKDEKGNVKKTGSVKLNETLNYDQFAERMHSLSLKKRTMLMNKKKAFCDKIKEEALLNVKKK